MSKVGKRKGSAKREPGAGPVETVDLPTLEPDHPTGRADVFFGDDVFEKRLEDVKFELRVETLGAFRAEIHAGPLSPVSLTITGCLCTLVLHVTSAPEWAQLSGLLLPWAIALSWVGIRALAFRRGAIDHRGERGQRQRSSVPSDAQAPAAAET
jgi:hypothetical protein